MARRKQVAPMQRINSGEVMQSLPDNAERPAQYTVSNGHLTSSVKQKYMSATAASRKPYKDTRLQAGVIQLLICVGGIYASFLTWGLLQERITMTPYHPQPGAPFTDTLQGRRPAEGQEYWRFSVVLNWVQAMCACMSGTLYLLATRRKGEVILPSSEALGPLLMVAVTSTLASPFGYASLAHVDYLTFVLAKSCKLLPVMALHVILYRKRYVLSKYAIVLAVTTGVAIFTIYHPPKPGKVAKEPKTSSYYGLILLGVNLLFDGLTNTTQDRIFSNQSKYGRVTSAQMMSITNFFSSVLMGIYLLVTPHIPAKVLPPFARPSSTHELSAALEFLRRHPSLTQDIALFALCGATGQLFIFATLERFSSLLLVTVTVTRKMLTMVLSVVWYGKSLSQGQWMGVGLVFGGIGTESWLAAEEKKAKERMKMRGKKEW